MSTVVQKRNEDLRREKDTGKGPPPTLDHDSFGNGNGENHFDKPNSNSIVAMLLFIGAELMFFAGLIGAFIVLRFGAMDWPPAGQPRLPVAVTGINTAILLFSGLTMFNTRRR
ncbi:MAG: hypothetical protein ACE5I1_26500, partial [bacterium]